MPRSEAQKKAQQKYAKEHTKAVTMKYYSSANSSMEDYLKLKKMADEKGIGISALAKGIIQDYLNDPEKMLQVSNNIVAVETNSNAGNTESKDWKFEHKYYNWLKNYFEEEDWRFVQENFGEEAFELIYDWIDYGLEEYFEEHLDQYIIDEVGERIYELKSDLEDDDVEDKYEVLESIFGNKLHLEIPWC